MQKKNGTSFTTASEVPYSASLKPYLVKLLTKATIQHRCQFRDDGKRQTTRRG